MDRSNEDIKALREMLLSPGWLVLSEMVAAQVERNLVALNSENDVRTIYRLQGETRGLSKVGVMVAEAVATVYEP